MTEREYILARLQVEREQRMSRWNVSGRQDERVQPEQPSRVLAAVRADQHCRAEWLGVAA